MKHFCYVILCMLMSVLIVDPIYLILFSSFCNSMKMFWFVQWFACMSQGHQIVQLLRYSSQLVVTYILDNCKCLRADV